MKKVFVVEPTNKSEDEFRKDYTNIRKFLRGKYPNEELEITSSLNTEVQVPIEKTDKAKLLYVSMVLQNHIADTDLVVFAPGWNEYRGYRVLHTCCIEYGIEIAEM